MGHGYKGCWCIRRSHQWCLQNIVGRAVGEEGVAIGREVFGEIGLGENREDVGDSSRVAKRELSRVRLARFLELVKARGIELEWW